MTTRIITAAPLTRESFAPYGEVIETAGAESFLINEGTTRRFHDLAPVDVLAEGGRPLISLFRAQPRRLPLPVTVMERHPLGSQAFVPITAEPFLVLVARPGPPPEPEDLVGFVTDGRQGVNYARGIWHHPLIALNREGDFVVIDRGGEGENLEETAFEAGTVELRL